jgi:NAD(P)H dehydrogenase (quinone)
VTDAPSFSPAVATGAGVDPPTVLVTGAGGKTGRAVMQALARHGARPRAFVRDAAKVADLDVEVAVGDQRRVDDLVAALGGADAVYAIAPNVSAHEVEMGEAIVTACQRAGVTRLVFHSVIHPQLTAMPHHTDKGRVEERVIASGLDWTILQPNAYLQNIGAQVAALRDGTYRTPYAVDAGLAMVDLADVAEVAARALVDDLGVHATFELSGPDEVTGQQVAAVAAELLGRPVVAERLSPATWAAENAGLPDVARERLLAMFTDYDRHGSPGDATVLTALLGRPPRGLRDVLRDLLAAA